MTMLQHSVIESGGYNIDRSLRFRSSASAYLNRTPASAGNRRTWTWSGWVKRGRLATALTYLYRVDSTNTDRCEFDSSDRLMIQQNDTTIRVSTQVFRDPSAWYHIIIAMDTTQATANNRTRVYVNDSEITAWTTQTNNAQNTDGNINSTNSHKFFGVGNTSEAFDGYIAELNFIDGQALTPSSFGQTDAVTGVWIPKKYTGTYGTNGFYLDFKNNTSATTLAYDKSGNGNNWTPNNISTTAGATYDSMTDVPTLTSATAANYCVLNPLASNVAGLAPQQGNLYWGNSASYNSAVTGSIGVSSGKWYWECKADSAYYFTGISAIPQLPANIAPHQATSQSKIYYSSNGQKYDNGNNAIYGATWGTADICGVALDMDAGTITFYKNNVSQGTAYSGLSGMYWPVIGGANGANVGYINFGQRPFSYTPPTGFKALNTFNLPDPVIKKPNQYMDVKLDTGANIKGTAESTFTGDDLIWIKDRANANNQQLIDTVRGSTAVLQSNTTAAETTYSTPSGNSVAWCWKESATSGFDIVTYTGTGANRTVSHSLGVAPKMMIIKSRNTAGTYWAVYHESIGNTKAIWLQLTGGASSASATYWNNTSPTSTDFTVGTDTSFNGNTYTYVAYLFAEIPQFSKAFSFTGNASTDGSFVHLGFKPKAVLLKCSSTTGNWYLFDTVRNTYNVLGEQLYPNLSNAGSTITTLDALSNGFKMRLTGDPNAAQTYIGFAWADSPVKYSNAF